MSSNYMQHLTQLIGREVRINRGGPDSSVGKMLSVQTDYLALQTKEGVIYINTSHIKSVSQTNANASGAYSSSPRYMTGYNFHAILQGMTHQFIQINRGGPEKIEGFVVEYNDDYLLMVVNRDVIRVPVFHIKSVNLLSKSGGNKSGQNQNTNKSSSNKGSKQGSSKKGSSNKSNHKSSTNKSTNKSTTNKSNTSKSASNKKMYW